MHYESIESTGRISTMSQSGSVAICYMLFDEVHW